MPSQKLRTGGSDACLRSMHEKKTCNVVLLLGPVCSIAIILPVVPVVVVVVAFGTGVKSYISVLVLTVLLLLINFCSDDVDFCYCCYENY